MVGKYKVGRDSLDSSPCLIRPRFVGKFNS